MHTSKSTYLTGGKFITACLLFFGFTLSVCAQKRTVSGFVYDSQTKEPLPFVNVYCENQMAVGISTDTLGYFSLMLPAEAKNIAFSFVSYETKVIPIDDLKTDHNKIFLDAILNQIQEINVKPGKNPAHALLKLIHEHKKQNDPSRVSPLDEMVYNKTTVALRNLDDETMRNPIFAGMNRSLVMSSDSSLVMPLLVTEELIHLVSDPANDLDYKHQLNYHNNGLSFFNSPDMMEFVAPITERVNFYQNYIQVMNRDFASPLGFNAPVNYRMYITDTLVQNGKQQFRIDFESRYPKDLAFNGYLWVENGSFALTEIVAELNPAANINLIKHLKVHNLFEPISDSLWYYKKQEVDITFKYHLNNDTSKQQVLLEARKTSQYDKNLQAVREQVAVKDHLLKPTREQREFMMQHYRQLEVDTAFEKMNLSLYALKQNPVIYHIEKLMDMGLKGYYSAGVLDVGPFLDIYRKNYVEGDRLNVPLRTSKQLAENFSIGGYYGYGFKDKKSKYGTNLFLKHPRTLYDVVGLSYWTDVTLIGHNDHLSLVKENSYSYGEDNLISAMFQINENRYMSQKTQFSAFLEHDWKRGFASKLKYEKNQVEEGVYVPFTQNGTSVNHIDYYEVSLTTRLSFNEDYYDAFFHRLYFGNRYPIINLKLAAGQYTARQVSNPYYSVHLAFKHKLIFGSMFMRYLIEAGHIFGEVPYPLLELHRGNETFGYARYYYNLLQNMEYASDTYINIHSTLYLNGILLNKIPIIRALELREVVSFKGIIGTLNSNHQNVMDFPDRLGAVHSPYAEVGVGITNFLRILRIEYVKRLTDFDKPGVWKDGIRFRVEFNF